MLAKIEQVNKYKITIGGVVHTDFEKSDEWEGMIKFKGPSGVLIVSKGREEFVPLFSRIFGEETEVLTDLEIVKASPELIRVPEDSA